MKRSFFPLLAVLLAGTAGALAQDAARPAPLALENRHQLSFSFGFKTNSKSAVATGLASVDVETGFLSSLAYGYWFSPEWQLNFSAGLFGTETKVTWKGVATGATIPVLFGISYYPLSLSMGSVGRPYAGIAAGVYIGSATRATTGLLTTTESETVLGGRITLGVDLFVAQWFKLGPSLSYHLLDDFTRVTAEKKNYSGAEFSINFGFIL
jgi:hypothetical protein